MQAFRWIQAFLLIGNFNQNEINPTSPIYKVMRDGLRTVLKIQQNIQDLYGKLSLVLEKSELKDVNYIPIKEKGLFVPVKLVYVITCGVCSNIDENLYLPSSKQNLPAIQDYVR